MLESPTSTPLQTFEDISLFSIPRDDNTVYLWEIETSPTVKARVNVVIDMALKSVFGDNAAAQRRDVRSIVQALLLWGAVLFFLLLPLLTLFVCGVFLIPLMVFLLLEATIGDSSTLNVAWLVIGIFCLTGALMLFRALRNTNFVHRYYGDREDLMTSWEQFRHRLKYLVVPLFAGSLLYVTVCPLSSVHAGFTGHDASRFVWFGYFSEVLVNTAYYNSFGTLFGRLTPIEPATWKAKFVIWVYKTLIVIGLLNAIWSAVSRMMASDRLFPNITERSHQFFQGTLVQLVQYVQSQPHLDDMDVLVCIKASVLKGYSCEPVPFEGLKRRFEPGAR